MANRVGLLSDNSVDTILKMLELWKQGKTVVLISGDAPIDAVNNIIKENEIEVCFCNLQMVATYELHLVGVTVYGFPVTATNWLYTDKLQKYLMPKSDQTALVLYSSGTTGRAKGIMLSHRAINENADAIIQYMSPNKNDVFAIIKNLAHSSTIVGEVLVAIKCGCPIFCIPEHRNIRHILEELFTSKASITCMNPTILALMMKLSANTLADKLQGLRKIYVSGAILSESLLLGARKILTQCKIYNVYGMTECGPRISSQELSTHINNNSVGKPIYGVNVRIVDSVGEKKIGDNSLGRIEVKTPYRFKGYVTEHCMSMSSDEWINTGDIGYLDKEQNLYIIGRADNMLNCVGHNVYPESIEEIIKNVQGVNECMVVGVKDEISGCILCCYYTGESANKKDIYEQCKAQLLPHEIPKKYVLVDSFQYANGKIRRKQFEE